MLSAKSVYQDVQFMLGKENGYISDADYNRLSRRGENRLMEWITGDIRGGIPPEPYRTQKNKDFVAPFITKYVSLIDDNGAITIPQDYHSFENLYVLSIDDSCDEGNGKIIKSTIELLNGQEYYNRVNTFIKELKPTIKAPIAKQVGRTFEFHPPELEGVTLEYIRYSKYARIISTLDPVYNVPVIDESQSTPYEWDENARECLVWFISDLLANHFREQALKQFNQATGKTVNQS